MYTNKNLLIIGGAVSFGNAIMKRMLKTDIKEIIFFRDEEKQDNMRKVR
jgi:UDP-N-acetylglucosamine 4,6-dehydratase